VRQNFGFEICIQVLAVVHTQGHGGGMYTGPNVVRDCEGMHLNYRVVMWNKKTIIIYCIVDSYCAASTKAHRLEIKTILLHLFCYFQIWYLWRPLVVKCFT
jgi:hypothetical protein